MNQTVQIFENIIIFIIIIHALFCYSILLELCFFSKKDESWQSSIQVWSNSLPTLLGALPLLGLLGTISGLLDTFFFMTIDSGMDTSSLMSNGISEAMLTTQIGLVLVIPGWLLHTLLISLYRAHGIKQHKGSICVPP